MWRKIAWGIFVIFLIISLLPYVIPVTKATGMLVAPFENSLFANVDGVSLHYRVWQPEITEDANGNLNDNLNLNANNLNANNLNANNLNANNLNANNLNSTTNPTGSSIVNSNASGHIVLIHGLAGSTFSWRETVEVLQEAGHTVVAVDLPGFGYSDRSRGINHSQDNRAALVWTLLEQIEGAMEKESDGNIRWNLVGHSMGGGTVTAMANLRPDKTETVIYVDAAVLSGGNPGGLFAKYPPVGRWVQVIGRHFLLKEQRIETFLTSAYGRPATTEEVTGYLQPLQIAGTEGSFVDIIKTSTQTTTTELQNLKVPVRAIWGDHDSWVSIDDAYELQNIISDFDLRIIEGAYHSPMETEPDAFNQLLLQLLDK